MKGLLRLFLILVVGLAVVAGTASAQWYENFDSYVIGSGLHGQGGWHGWDGNPAADGLVSGLYSRSAPNSAQIAAASDLVHEYSGCNAGIWIYTAWQYVPDDFAGQTYFLLLNTYTDGGPYNWSSQVSFNSTGNIVLTEPEGTTLPLIRGRWVELRVEINLDQNFQTFYYDGQTLYQKSWTEGMSGGGALNIGAVDLYANGASPVYYDDMSLDVSPPVPIRESTWGRIKQSFR